VHGVHEATMPEAAREPVDRADHSGLFSKCCHKQPSGVGVAVIGHRPPLPVPHRQIFGILARRRLSDGLPNPPMASCPPLNARAGPLRCFGHRGCAAEDACNAVELGPPAFADGSQRTACRGRDRFWHDDLCRRPSRRRRYLDGVTGRVISRPGEPYDRPACPGCG
jgi:hypothetical protein